VVGHAVTIAVLIIGVLSSAGGSALARGSSAHVTSLGPASGGQSLQLTFPLKADVAGIERLAAAVAQPGSRDFGRYEAISALARRFGASAKTRRRVLAYLHRAGASKVSIDRTGLFAYATLSAGRAASLFGTPLTQFRTAKGARFVAPQRGARIPAGLRGAVTGVVGLNTRPLLSAPPSVSSNSARAHLASQPSSALPRTGTPSPSACAAGRSAGEMHGDPTTAGFTPNQYLTAYGFDPLHAAGLHGQGERVALIEIDGFRYSDIKAFASCFAFDIPAVNGFGVGVDHPLSPGGEATLDLEVLDAATPDLKAIDVYETKPNASDLLRALTSPLQNRGHKPQVVSASLGLCEPALKATVGNQGIRNSEAALAEASVSGTTFLASSGDQGSADCTLLNGHPRHSLAVNYPSSSPWVTGVGGTNFVLNPSNQITTQLVWNDTNAQPGLAAGGGSSVLFGRPSYERGTVSAKHRAVPDVSMLADIIPGYAIYCTASNICDPSRPWISVGGTSAATPLLAGGLALVDQELRAHHRQDLGLVNPLFYQLGRSSLRNQVFSDVLHYGNDVGQYIPGNGRALGCCSAHAGFDLASGWGSVNVTNFAAAAISRQPPRESLTLPGHQKPLKSHHILATVSCADKCRMGAVAAVKIGNRKPFGLASKVNVLNHAGKKTIRISFSRSQLSRLRKARRQHTKIRAAVAAVIVNSHNKLISETAAKVFTITG
jgi:kumamolisin